MFLVACFADEVDNDEVKTIRGSNVSARILARSGKLMIVRNDDDDDDDEEDGKDDSDSKDDKDDDTDDNDKDDKDGADDNDNDDKDDDDDDDDDDEDFGDDNEDLLSFELDEIEEKDSQGNEVDDKHSVKSFDDVKFTFGLVDKQADFQGIPVIKMNYSAYLPDPEATLEIIVYLFRGAGAIEFGNETFAVQSGTVKFNIKVAIKANRSILLLTLIVMLRLGFL